MIIVHLEIKVEKKCPAGAAGDPLPESLSLLIVYTEAGIQRDSEHHVKQVPWLPT